LVYFNTTDFYKGSHGRNNNNNNDIDIYEHCKKRENDLFTWNKNEDKRQNVPDFIVIHIDYNVEPNHTKGTYGKKETDDTNNNYIEKDTKGSTFDKRKNKILLVINFIF